MSPRSIVPIILCGGSGSRLWPLSRESFPKQYLSLGSDNNQTLLQKTQLRIHDFKNITPPILICNENHRFIVAEQLREIKIKNFTILLEPHGRNTAPAITIAALKALEKENDPILLVLSSDHEVLYKDRFKNVLESGLSYAEKGFLAIFGILPTYPETGYGYIKSEKPFTKDKLEGIKIEKFLEKPDFKTAQNFIKDKRYTWNSGMFMFKAKTILDEINRFSPEIMSCCQKALSLSNHDLDFQRLEKNNFKKCPNISIDVAVMEKTNKGIVLPLDAGWSDVGSWQSVWEMSKKDKAGNSILGKVVISDAKDSYLRSENRLLVGLGIKDLVVVETNDAVLVADRKNSQKVKNIVKELNEQNIPEGQLHSKIYRPWGHYLSLVGEEKWQVKLIHVKPNEKLSLQMHHHRAEHWVVVSGTAKVYVDGEIKILSENQSIYIPLGSKHRLSNPGQIPLTLIEVQSGTYVGEDDIVRFEDKYGRINPF